MSLNQINKIKNNYMILLTMSTTTITFMFVTFGFILMSFGFLFVGRQIAEVAATIKNTNDALNSVSFQLDMIDTSIKFFPIRPRKIMTKCGPTTRMSIKSKDAEADESFTIKTKRKSAKRKNKKDANQFMRIEQGVDKLVKSHKRLPNL